VREQESFSKREDLREQKKRIDSQQGGSLRKETTKHIFTELKDYH